MKYVHAQQKHVAKKTIVASDGSKLSHWQQKPLSQVTGVVNNPVCDPGDAFEHAAYS